MNSVTGAGRTLRVLHIGSMLYSGGVERWLTDLCKRGRPHHIEMEIAVLMKHESLFADVARQAKIPVHHCPGGGSNPLPFIRNLRKLIRERGPFDAIHSHIHLYSAFALIAGYLENIPVRIAHSHNVVGNDRGAWSRKVYAKLGRVLLGIFATHGLAPASKALEDMVGEGWQSDSRWKLMPCGISLEPFQAEIPDSARRQGLGLSPNDLVMVTVGRLTEEKNSDFLVEILGEMIRLEPRTRLVMIGEGPLKDTLRSRAEKGGYGDRLILAGLRPDVPDVLRGVADVFVFPSPPPPRGNEALPIAVIEAQVCGLPVIMADGVTVEAIVMKDQVLHLSSSESAAYWAKAILEFAGTHKVEAEQAQQVFSTSLFNIEQNLRYLRGLYLGQAQ